MILWRSIFVLAFPLAAAPSCESEARAWRGSTKSPDKLRLEQCASRVGTAPAAAARLSIAVSAAESQRPSDALPLLERVRPQLAKIDDYVAYYLATALADAERHDDAIAALEAVWRMRPESPLTGRSAMLAARSHLARGRSAAAAALLEKFEQQLPQPQGDMALADAWKAAGQKEKAGKYYARVYFRSPQSAEAERAVVEWKALGSPDATPQNYLARAERAGAGQAAAVRQELLAVSGDWTPEERDLAAVRAWSMEYKARRYAEARRGLAALQLESPTADAERTWMLYQISRRLDSDADRISTFDRLAKYHVGSPWYLEALLSEGYRLIRENDFSGYEPVYKACVDGFERDSRAPFCHWKLVWSDYLHRRPAARQSLLDHVERFPQSEKINTALYFLGRMAEQERKHDAARTYYQWVSARYPNTYYALISEERLRQPAFKSSATSMEVKHWLENRRWPRRAAFPPSEVAEAQARRERAALLQMAGLDTFAEMELRTGARAEPMQLGLAMDLAEFMGHVGQADKGLRYIKGLLPGYLYFPWDAAGDRFWKLAFPLPFQDDLEKYSAENGIDPYIVAGLIRQESEFNPKVVSRANAYGLTQIVPSTGRDLSRRIGLKSFRTPMLFDPAVNLRLGTYYLKSLLRSFDGRWEDVLAGYNGGPSRARRWRTFGEFQEQAEYIETIPFDETRDYVQSVLRNAAVYRKLYSRPAAAIHSTNEPRPVAQPARGNATAAKKPVPKRKNR